MTIYTSLQRKTQVEFMARIIWLFTFLLDENEQYLENYSGCGYFSSWSSKVHFSCNQLKFIIQIQSNEAVV